MKEGVPLKKRIIIGIIPYIFGIAYLIFCLLNVELWVKSHLETHLLYIEIARIAAVVSFVILKHRKNEFYFVLPAFCFVISMIVDIVAKGIPCCSGG